MCFLVLHVFSALCLGNIVLVCFLVLHVFCVLCLGSRKMVQSMKEIVSEYEDRLWKMQLVPRFSYGRGLRRKDGASNKMFLT